MYKVLIAEDEKAARERITGMALWKEGDFTICSAESNGAVAFEAYKKTNPDLIITDIEMPVMNGLDFIEKIRETGSEIPIIILSCYESFSYAQRAIKLKVSDYLIKDFLEESVLKNTLIHALKIYKSRSGGNNDSGTPFDMKRCKTPEELKKLKEIEKNNRMRFLYMRTEGNIENFYTSIKEELELEYCSASIVEDSNNMAVLLMAPGPINMEKAAEQIIDRIEKESGESITIAAGKEFGNPDSLEKEYTTVKNLMNYSIFLGNKKLILEQGVSQISYLDPDIMEINLRLLKKASAGKNRENFFISLEQLFSINTSGMIEYTYIEYINSHLAALAIAVVEENRLKTSRYFKPELLDFQEIRSLNSVKEIHNWYKERFTEIFSLVEKEEIKVIENIHVKEAVSIIKKEYPEDLSLDILSLRTGIHRVYLSRIFKKETGKTCLEYIQETRVDKAKNLLLYTQKKIAEVALETGFKNYDQFALVFKKITGDTPTNFRKKYK